MEKSIVIRPEPRVFADFEGESFEQTAQQTGSESLKKMITSQKTIVYYTEQVTYPDYGIMMKYKDVPYLRQGFIFPEAMDNVNNLKRLSTLFLAVFNGKGIRGRIGAFLGHYVHIADWVFLWYDPNSQKVRKIYLKENRYRQSVRELIVWINELLFNLKIEPFYGEPKDFGRVVGTMLEYDNAYHWRFEDLMRETSKELLRNPRKELNRLLEIYKLREKSSIEFKAESIVKFLRLILLIPSVKKAWLKTLENIDIEKMKMLPDDRYFTMNYEGYDFEGRTIEDRQKEWLAMTGGKIPKRVVI
jgi:hypothetical protein